MTSKQIMIKVIIEVNSWMLWKLVGLWSLVATYVAAMAIFVVGGGSLAAYKMKQWVSGLTEFEIYKEYDTPQHVSDSSSDDDNNYLNGNISKQWHKNDV
jgi:hypothetical protein